MKFDFNGWNIQYVFESLFISTSKMQYNHYNTFSDIMGDM